MVNQLLAAFASELRSDISVLLFVMRTLPSTKRECKLVVCHLNNINIGSKNSKAVPLRSVSAKVTLESSSEYVGLLRKYRLHNKMKLLSFLGSDLSKVSGCFT